MSATSFNGKTKWLNIDENGMKIASDLILQGETVAFPTETVYGLGANALQSTAVDKIFLAKGRPGDNPLIIHIWSISQLNLLTEEISDKAKLLMEKFWPGPLTLIFPKRAEVPLKTTGGLETVAVRMPSHPVALELLKRCNVPIAAPSANRSGKPSPTTAQHVLEDLNGRIAAILDGGTCGVGVESSVLDLTVSPPAMLRPGAITSEQVSKILGEPVLDERTFRQTPNVKESPKAPGMKYTHYAPNAELFAVGNGTAELEAIQNYVDEDRAGGLKIGVLATEESRDFYQADLVISCGRRSDLTTIAHGLYPALREFNHHPIDRIYAETFPREGIGVAIMNRLSKSAGGRKK